MSRAFAPFVSYVFLQCVNWRGLSMEQGSGCVFDEPVSLLQTHTNRGKAWGRSDRTSSPSSSALGAMRERWALYSQGSLPRAWPDACFSSVIQGHTEPDPAMLSQWMQAPCSCGSPSSPLRWTLPPKMDVSEVMADNVEDELPWQQSAISYPLENHARTVGIDSALDVLLAQTPNAQVVNLGAGFDGRFYALPCLGKASALVEMDLADSQVLKSALVHNCNLSPMSKAEVDFLPLDLCKDDIYDHLKQLGTFNPSQPTIFISEAVLQYLPEKCVMKTVETLARGMHLNPANRFILQSWVGNIMNTSTVDFYVLEDKVHFNFPADPAARSAWWNNLRLVSDKSKATQRVLMAFNQEINGLIPGAGLHEYLDVLQGAR